MEYSRNFFAKFWINRKISRIEILGFSESSRNFSLEYALLFSRLDPTNLCLLNSWFWWCIPLRMGRKWASLPETRRIARRMWRTTLRNSQDKWRASATFALSEKADAVREAFFVDLYLEISRILDYLKFILCRIFLNDFY